MLSQETYIQKRQIALKYFKWSCYLTKRYSEGFPINLHTPTRYICGEIPGEITGEICSEICSEICGVDWARRCKWMQSTPGLSQYFKHDTTVTLACQRWTKFGLFKISFPYILARRAQMYCKLILKSPKFLLFGDYLSQFRDNFDIPAVSRSPSESGVG